MQETIEWISCAERMPETFHDVLIKAMDFPGGTIGEAFCGNRGWIWANGDRVVSEVTHWADFPKGPQGE